MVNLQHSENTGFRCFPNIPHGRSHWKTTNAQASGKNSCFESVMQRLLHGRFVVYCSYVVALRYQTAGSRLNSRRKEGKRRHRSTKARAFFEKQFRKSQSAIIIFQDIKTTSSSNQFQSTLPINNIQTPSLYYGYINLRHL